MVIITRYYKCSARTGRHHVAAWFLPLSVSRLVLLYLLHVRPFVCYLLGVTYEHSARRRQRVRWEVQNPSPSRPGWPGPAAAGGEHDLFAVPGSRPLGPRRACSLYGQVLQQSSWEFFGDFSLQALTYRHLVIAVAKKHLRAQATVVDLRSAA
jgi:hypothetical protein